MNFLRSNLGLWLFWLLVLACVYGAFEHFVFSRQPAATTLEATGGQVLQVRKGRDGHFRLPGTLNGAPAILMVDTGASSVTLDEDLARQLNLPVGERFTTQTANGPVEAYATVLAELRLGPFTLRQVSAAVVPRLGDEILLGMNVLRRFKLEIQGEQLQLSPLEQSSH